MASELRYLQQRYAEAIFDRTPQGRLYVLMRHATGFYCIFRSLVVRLHWPPSHPSHNCFSTSPSRTSFSQPHTQPPRLIPIRGPISSRQPSFYLYPIRRLRQKRI